jgi:hypothetical protein
MVCRWASRLCELIGGSGFRTLRRNTFMADRWEWLQGLGLDGWEWLQGLGLDGWEWLQG